MQRRTWLQACAPWMASAATGGVLGLGGLAGGAHAATAPAGAAPDARFLLVFLRGGYDGLSALVPTQRTFYDEVRKDIALPAASLRTLDADWAMHPALASTLAPLLDRGEVAFLPYAGTPNASRSHFETQDSIELGLGASLVAGGTRDFQTGFLNRLARQLGGRAAIGFTDQLPLALRGDLPVANVSLRAPPRPGDMAALQAGMLAMYREHPLRDKVEAAFAVRDQVAQQLAEEAARARAAAPNPVTALVTAPASGGAMAMAGDNAMAGGMANPMASPMASPATPPAAKPPASGMASPAVANEMAAASRNAVLPRGFELEARRVARLMRERYSIGFVDVGGWDTHYNQGAATGALAGRLEELGRGLAGFADELGPAAWRQTVVVVLSEFGRTVRENGTRGTDHGHGTVYWVLGGGLAGRSPVRGEQVPLTAATLFQNRDLPVLNDYRTLLAGLWARQFGLGPAALGEVFAGVAPRDYGLL